MTTDYSHDLPLPVFDRDLGLEELLSGIELSKLKSILSELLPEPFRLVCVEGKVLIGDGNAAAEDRDRDGMQANRFPLRHDMETLGYLELAVESANAQAAAHLVEMLLVSSARYLMTSDLHLRTVQEDFESLQKKHTELLASEARYKDLSIQLEQRVAEQVTTIEGAQRQLYQAEKMASVGQLAAGVAHEINNPIGFINSNLSTAKSYIEKLAVFAKAFHSNISKEDLLKLWATNDFDFMLEDFEPLIQESIDGATRVTKIVKDLKGFSNVDRDEEEVVNINDTISSVCNIGEREITKHATLELDLGKLPMTRCYPAHLGQVFLNLLLNAGLAIKESGTVSVKSSYMDKRITIQINDTGTGMSEETLAKVFDPFFTTRDVGQGTGLGLTVCRDIIHSHDGEMTIESKQGQGTTVTIWIPVIQ